MIVSKNKRKITNSSEKHHQNSVDELITALLGANLELCFLGKNPVKIVT